MLEIEIKLNILKDLYATLGISICRIKGLGIEYFNFKLTHNGIRLQSIIENNNNFSIICCWLSKNDMFFILKHAISFYTDEGGKKIDFKEISNPYFGCSSLEEMLIKKDLLYGKNI